MELVERIPTDRTAFINTMDFTTFKIYSSNSKNDDYPVGSWREIVLR